MKKLTATLVRAAVAFAVLVGGGAAVAFAALVGGLAGPAGAVLPGTVGGPGNTADPGPRYNTGSANLDKLANALTLHNKSVSAVLRAPAGLQLSRPVQIRTVYNAGGETQVYSNSKGNKLVEQFVAGDGRPRRERLTITLEERDLITNRVVGSFVINTGVDIEALWDIHISPLRIHFWDRCDWHSDIDPVVFWSDVVGVMHESREFDPDPGDTVTIDQGFSGVWREVKVADALLEPKIEWIEKDGFSPPPPPFVGPPLLPTQGFNKEFDLLAYTSNGLGDCSATFSFSVGVHLDAYPNLPNP